MSRNYYIKYYRNPISGKVSDTKIDDTYEVIKIIPRDKKKGFTCFICGELCKIKANN